jgi:iron-sulfur cluster assembly protein
MITLSETGAVYVKKYLADRGKGVGIRLTVNTSGCSGFQYLLEPVDQVLITDIKFESHGIAIYTDPKSHLYLTGTEMNYVDKLMGGGFEFNNPNATDFCGCGESFNV